MLFSRYRADQVSCQLRVLQNAKNCHIGITGARRYFVTNVSLGEYDFPTEGRAALDDACYGGATVLTFSRPTAPF